MRHLSGGDDDQGSGVLADAASYRGGPAVDRIRELVGQLRHEKPPAAVFDPRPLLPAADPDARRTA